MDPKPYEERHRAGQDELEEIFALLGNALPSPIIAYDIGGAPMVYRNLKDGTKDVDLVVLSKKDRDAIKSTLCDGYGYKQQFNLPGYEGLDGFILQREGHVGVDVFVIKIMDKLCLTESMQKRADPPIKFGNLQIRHCSNEDIFLLKAITQRPDDEEDVIALVQSGLDTATIKEEIAVQEIISPNSWARLIFRELEDIERRTGVFLPIREELI